MRTKVLTETWER